METIIRDFICGSISGFTNCVSGYIFDTLKVRMQVEPNLKMISTLKNIVKN
jgi:hypothetical protein